MARSAARWVKKPSAICERPALWVHRNSTTGIAVGVLAFDPGQRVQALPGEPLGQSGR